MRVRWLAVLVLGAVVVCVVLVSFAFFGMLAWEHSNVSSSSDTSCPVPGEDSSSNYTPSEWRWMPPGRVCVYEGTTFDGPRWTRALGVVVLPLTLVASIVVLVATTRRALAASRAQVAASA